MFTSGITFNLVSKSLSCLSCLSDAVPVSNERCLYIRRGRYPSIILKRAPCFFQKSVETFKWLHEWDSAWSFSFLPPLLQSPPNSPCWSLYFEHYPSFIQLTPVQSVGHSLPGISSRKLVPLLTLISLHYNCLLCLYVPPLVSEFYEDQDHVCLVH